MPRGCELTPGRFAAIDNNRKSPDNHPMQENKPDSQVFLRAIFWAVLVFLIYQLVVIQFVQPPAPQQPVTSAPAGSSPSATTQPDDATSGKFTIRGADRPQTLTLGGVAGFKKSPHRMELTLSSVGASISKALLSDYRMNVRGDERYRLLEEILLPGGETRRSLTLQDISIDGVNLDLSKANWNAQLREDSAGASAVFSLTIEEEGQPAVELERVYTLPAQPHESGRSDLRLALTVRNLGDHPRNIIASHTGPVGLSREARFGVDRKVYAAVQDSGVIDLESFAFDKVAKQSRIKAFVADDHQPNRQLSWTGCGNQYFTCTYCPVDAEGNIAPQDIAEVVAVDLDEDKETQEAATTRVTTQRITVQPQAEHTLRAEMYLGPKNRAAFDSPQNADYIARQYMLTIKDGYGSCTFNFLTDLMIRMLDWFESIVHNYGVAIFILVIIVRALLHPITKRTQVNMVRMQQNMGKVQPKLEEIKKKYGNDSRRMQQEIMKVYRDEGINPFGQMLSCLPMLLQMPIWIALYSSLSNNFAMRGRGFIWWIHDLTEPDRLIEFGPVQVPVFGELDAFNLLPILVGVMMFAQQKLMPKPKKPDNAPTSPQAQQAEQMQKIMPYMSLVMILLFYKFPAGLNLYIMTSSLIGTAEQIYIRRHLAKEEVAPGESGGPGPLAKNKPKRPLPGRGLWQRLEKMADEARNLQSNRDRSKQRR